MAEPTPPKIPSKPVEQSGFNRRGQDFLSRSKWFSPVSEWAGKYGVPWDESTQKKFLEVLKTEQSNLEGKSEASPPESTAREDLNQMAEKDAHWSRRSADLIARAQSVSRMLEVFGEMSGKPWTQEQIIAFTLAAASGNTNSPEAPTSK